MTGVTLKGFKEFEDKLKNLSADVLEEVDAEVEDSALLWVDLAVQAAPVDFGFLKQNISAKKATTGWEIVSGAFYSAYMEWGTKTYVSVPPEQQAYASQFKGPANAGDYFDFLNSILDWVKRKNLAQITNSYTGRKSTKKDDLLLVAQTIAFFIMKKGVRPHPFFFIQHPKVEAFLIDNVRKVLNTAH